MIESSVLLPPTLGPTSATNSPRATTRLRSASAVTVPPVRPRPAGKRIVTPRTSSSGAPALAARAASGVAVSRVAIRQPPLRGGPGARYKRQGDAGTCQRPLAMPVSYTSTCSLRWHYPDQVPSVGGGGTATLSARLPELPLRRGNMKL